MPRSALLAALAAAIALGGGGYAAGHFTAAERPTAPRTVYVPVPAPPSTTTAPVSTTTLDPTVAMLSGPGAGNSAPFALLREPWSVAYSYTCASGPSNFIANVELGAGSVPVANVIGTSGTGTGYGYVTGSAYLYVNSPCAWSATVTYGPG